MEEKSNCPNCGNEYERKYHYNIDSGNVKIDILYSYGVNIIDENIKTGWFSHKIIKKIYCNKCNWRLDLIGCNMHP